MNEKHIFALWNGELSESLSYRRDELTVIEETLVHRIIYVLRMARGDQCIFFDQNYHVLSRFEKSEKKKVYFSVIKINQSQKEGNELHIVLPLLKKDDYDTALYGLTAVGVSSISIILTEKTQRGWHGAVDYERSLRIIRAAAEQSKNFSMPLLFSPQTLYDYCEQKNYKDEQKLHVADPEGMSLRTLMKNNDVLNGAAICVGPEGGFSQAEQDYLQKYGVQRWRLTPTVLKAEQAIVLFAGIIRSLF